MVYGKAPFQDIVHQGRKFAAISNPSTKIEFPNLPNLNLVNTMQSCLQYYPKDRPNISELLNHPYLKAS